MPFAPCCARPCLGLCRLWLCRGETGCTQAGRQAPETCAGPRKRPVQPPSPCSAADVATLGTLASLEVLDLRRQLYCPEDAHPQRWLDQLRAALPCCDILV